jgi:DNA-binding beta-propeller fold protein YncE
MHYAGLLTNVVQVTSDEGATGIYTVTSSVFARHDVYLPLLAHNLGPPAFCAPQLIAEVNTGPQPHGVALDVAGRRAFVAHAGGLTVISADDLAVLTGTQTFTSAQGVAYDPDRDRIWIARRDPDRVLVLDGTTYAPLADLPAGGGALGVVYNPANGRVYVSNFFSWTVGVYDAATLAHVVDLTDFAEPSHLAVNPTTNKIYVANHWPSNHVTVVDGATHNSHRIQTGLLDAYGVAVDATRNLVYVTAISQGRVVVIDGATDTQLGYLDVKRGSGMRVSLRVVAVNPDVGDEGHLWLVTSSEDGGSDQLLLIPNGWPTLGTPLPLDIAPYPLDGILYDPGSGQVWVTSVGDGSVGVAQDGEPLCDVPFSTGAEQEDLFWLQAFPQP